MILFSHMLKAGGTTLRRLLEDVYQGGLITDYDDIPMSNRPEHVLGRRERLQTLRSQGVPPNAKIVFGHFVLSKYQGLVPEPRFATMFRDPAARLLSHYFHYQRNIGNDRNEILPKDIRLEAFARLPKYRDMYAYFLGGLEIEDLDYIGLTEEFTASVALFFKLFPCKQAPEIVQRAAALRLNQAGEYSDAILYLQQQGQLDDVRWAQRVNETIYAKAKSRFAALCHQHGVQRDAIS